MSTCPLSKGLATRFLSLVIANKAISNSTWMCTSTSIYTTSSSVRDNQYKSWDYVTTYSIGSTKLAL